MSYVYFQNGQAKLYIWNLYRGSSREIYQRVSSLSRFDVYGIGYNKATPTTYKVLRIYDGSLDDTTERGAEEVTVEILDFRTLRWKKLDMLLDWQVIESCPRLSIGGKMCWFAYSKTKLGFIQGFNFTTETLKNVCDLSFSYNEQNATLSLAAYRGNHLSLLHQPATISDIHMRVTTPLDNDCVSWTRLFIVTDPNLPRLRSVYSSAYPSHFFTKENMILVWFRDEEEEDDSDVDDYVRANLWMYKIGKGGVQTHVRMDGETFWESLMCGYVYTPTFVHVPNLPQFAYAYKTEAEVTSILKLKHRTFD